VFDDEFTSRYIIKTRSDIEQFPPRVHYTYSRTSKEQLHRENHEKIDVERSTRDIVNRL